MKKLAILILCLCVFSSISLAQSEKTGAKSPDPRSTTKKGFPNIFRPITGWFKGLFAEKIVCQLTHPHIKNISLSQDEITATISASENSTVLPDSIVQVVSEGDDFEFDVLTFKYEVSGGKIIGTGAKVAWDLSNLKPGIYTITAMVDDGCGFCSPATKKTITVK